MLARRKKDTKDTRKKGRRRVVRRRGNRRNSTTQAAARGAAAAAATQLCARRWEKDGARNERRKRERGCVCESLAGAASREVGRGTTRAATGVGGGRARWTSGYFKRRLFWHFAPSFPRAHPLASDSRVLVSVSPRRQPQSVSQSVNR